MYYIIWKYTVDNTKQQKFEEEYDRNGSWFKFFEPCNDYMGHDLLKNMDGETYLLIDKWMSKNDYENFLKSNQLEYDAINNRSKELYDLEEQIGLFNSI
ncbi:MAG: hypothetical protein GY816_13970 [Cytophagales bacterium]|nr:hypothetical protein [Cytophagales bacterium]